MFFLKVPPYSGRTRMTKGCGGACQGLKQPESLSMDSGCIGIEMCYFSLHPALCLCSSTIWRKRPLCFISSEGVPCSVTLAHPVGDDQNRLAGEQAGEGFLNSALIFHVQAGGCLIQKDDRRIFQKRAGDGDPLALAAGEGGAVLAGPGAGPG